MASDDSGSSAITCTSVAPALTSISPTAGPGGTVTLTGTGFYGTTVVKFGALDAASFTINSATQITAKTPPGTGTVVVRVTTDAGTTPETNVTYQYNVPTIALSPPSLPNGALLAGYSQALTASGGTGPHMFAVTAGSLPAGLALLPGGTLSGTPTVRGTFNFTVTATDNIGYTASQGYTITIDLASQTLTFGVPPTVLFNGTGTVTASTTAAPGSSYPITFSTTSADCQVSSTGLVTGTSAGTNNCLVTATQAGDATYASASATQLLSVGKAAQAALTVTAAPAHITPGATSTLGTTGGSGTGAVSYAVTAGNAFCTVNGATLTGTGVGTCTVTATRAADANHDAATAAVDVRVAVVQPVPLDGRWLPLMAVVLAGLGAAFRRRQGGW